MDTSWEEEMSAKACDHCGGLIVFGHDKDTGRVLPLSVGSAVYRIVKKNIVELDKKALVRHVCMTKPEPPPVVRDFTQSGTSEIYE